jgi:hypothetical protein
MFDVVTHIALEASPEQAWRVLMDFPAFPEWNEFIRHIEGEAKVGARLRGRIQMQGSSAFTFRPTVLAVHEAREFRWLGQLLIPGLFDGEHFFLMQPRGRGTELTHGERFRGIVAGLMKARLVPRLEASFSAFNRAFKARVEGCRSP